jgi:two-component system phosphate regulon sensor histidine kinase PhoR
MRADGLRPFYLLIVGNLLIVIGVFAVQGALSYRSLDAEYLREVEVHQRQLAAIGRQYVEHIWPLPDTDVDCLAKDFAGEFSEAAAGGRAAAAAEEPLRLTIIAPDGRVLGDSQADPTTMENHKTADRPEVLAALEGRPGADVRRSGTLAVEFRYVALPVRQKGAVVGAVRVAMPITAIQRPQAVIRDTVVWTAATAVVVFALVALLVNWAWYQARRRAARPPAADEA